MRIFASELSKKRRRIIEETKAVFLFTRDSISPLFTKPEEIEIIVKRNHKCGVVSWRFQNPEIAKQEHRSMLKTRELVLS